MVRQLNLTKATAEFTDNSALIFGKDDGLTLEIISEYNLSEAVITFCNGKVQKTVKLIGNNVTVPQEILFSGWLSIGVLMYLDGEIVKKWQILPLKLIESTPEVVPEEIIQAHDEEIKVLKADKAELSTLKALEARLNDLAEKHNKLTEIVKLIKEV